MRDGAQPAPGEAQEIKDNSVIRIMGRAYAYQAIDNNGNIVFSAKTQFFNTIDDGTIPLADPMFYYVKQATLDAGATDAAKSRSYYEIAGLKEALKSSELLIFQMRHPIIFRGDYRSIKSCFCKKCSLSLWKLFLQKQVICFQFPDIRKQRQA